MSHDEIRVIGACPACNNYPGDCHCKDWLAENVRLQEDLSREREQRMDVERQNKLLAEQHVSKLFAPMVERIAALEDERDESRTALAASQREVERRDLDLDRWKAENARLNAQLAEANIREEQYRAIGERYKDEISALMSQLAEARRRCEEWRCEALAVRAKLDGEINLLRDKTRVERQAEGLQKQIAHWKAAGIERLKDNSAKQKAQWAMLKADRDTARSQLATAEAGVAAMRDVLDYCGKIFAFEREFKQNDWTWARDRVRAALATDAGRALLAERASLLSRLEKADALERTARGCEAALCSLLSIADESEGVAGYHLNGEVATWSSLGLDEWDRLHEALTADLAAYAAAKSKDATDE